MHAQGGRGGHGSLVTNTVENKLGAAYRARVHQTFIRFLRETSKAVDNKGRRPPYLRASAAEGTATDSKRRPGEKKGKGSATGSG